MHGTEAGNGNIPCRSLEQFYTVYIHLSSECFDLYINCNDALHSLFLAVVH